MCGTGGVAYYGTNTPLKLTSELTIVNHLPLRGDDLVLKIYLELTLKEVIMKRLSLPIKQIKDHYDVVVIGSGYGGGISASRMARANRSVCLLEKGKELLPGEYPNKEGDAVKEMQMDFGGEHIGSETAMYDFHFNDEINVFKGCGLGGTSLVNANISLPAEDWVMESDDWPSAIRADKAKLQEGFERAREMLNPTPYPNHYPELAKLKAMKRSSSLWDEASFYRPPINVTFKDGENQAGVNQKACNNCGDCVTGCNYFAKNTTLMNYLPDAANHGAEIFTQTAVDRIEQQNDKWIVRYKIMDAGREKFGDSTNFITADIVILAAGTLGSTEIMIRSKNEGLPVSDCLGNHFTGNGDFLAFGYNCDVDINAIGMGHKNPEDEDAVGPCIAGIIDLRKDKYTSGNRKEGMVIEEGVIPGALSAFVPWMLSFYDTFGGKDTDRGFRDFMRETWRKLRSFFGAYKGAANHTMTYLVMTHDDGRGEMFLENDRLRISWDDVGKQPIFKKVSNTLKKITGKLGGTYIKNPTWNKLFKHRLTTVHPLGGCIMAEDASGGVVNHKGQVFSGSSGKEVYEGLYVSDGSIIPRPLGVNPLLTISALTERNCHYIAEDYGWKIDYSLNRNSNGKGETKHKAGLQFTERMTGYFSEEAVDFEAGYNLGKDNDSDFSFVLTIRSDDIEAMLHNSEHQAHLIGTVQAPALSDDDLSVTDGVFNLLTTDPKNEDIRYMRYQMKLHSEEGNDYFFSGYKLLRDDQKFDIWEDTTTLFITLYEGENEQAPVAGRGILKIKPEDFRKQMCTVEVTGITDKTQKMKHQAAFLKFFSKNVADVYI